MKVDWLHVHHTVNMTCVIITNTYIFTRRASTFFVRVTGIDVRWLVLGDDELEHDYMFPTNPQSIIIDQVAK